MSWIKVLIGILLGAQVFVCLFLVLVVLMQRSKSDGLSGGTAFGGTFTDSIFGAGTTTVLVKMTSVLGALFFGISLLLAVLYAHENAGKVEFNKILAKDKSAAPVTNAVAAAANQVLQPTNHVFGASATNSASKASATATSTNKTTRAR
ncbi:MAG: preprotein translocase subunit SecG [Verrucomicrobiae bacterium]|nr:preprotein translocase subunit SecG [Verrucomicrobiae bacterium]